MSRGVKQPSKMIFTNECYYLRQKSRPDLDQWRC